MKFGPSIACFVTLALSAFSAESEKKIQLSSMDLSLIKQEWGQPQKDKSVAQYPLSTKSRRFEHGIGTHANSVMLVQLDGKAETFSSYMGINDMGGGFSGLVTFIIKGDGRELYNSGHIRHNDPAKFVNLPIKGILRLELIVDSTGSNGSDHANWGEATITYKGETPYLCDPHAEFAPESIYPLENKRIISPGNTTYYLDAIHGNDQATGTTKQTGWKSMSKLNSVVFAPGDQIYIAPGSYNQSFFPKGAGTPDKPIIVHLDKGNYEFSSLGMPLTRKYQISNTNDQPDIPKPIAFALENVKHMIIQGAPDHGSEIKVHGKMIYASMIQCENITWKNLAFDYPRPTMSEYTVTNVGENYIDVKIHPDSAYAIRNQQLFWEGEDWQLPAPQFAQQAEMDKQLLYRAQSAFVNATKVEELSPFNVRIYYSRKPNIPIGRLFQERNTTREMAGFFVANSKDIHWDYVNFYFIHGMGIVNQFTENLRFNHVRFAPRPNSGRTASCWADSVQVSSCKGEVVFSNCLFSGTHDDPINVHGTALGISSKVSDNRIIATFKHHQTFGFQPFFPEDFVEFIDNQTMTGYHLNQVESIKKIDAKNWEITFRSPIANFAQGHVLDNLSWYPQVTIDSCKVEMCSTRGFLITTMKPVVVKNTTFINTFMPAILVEGDANGWFESGRIRNMRIENNTFINCAEPVIAIQPGTRHEPEDTFVEKNITISNNTFRLKNDTAVSAKSVDGLEFTHNKLNKINNPVKTRACKNIKIENNSVNP